MQQQYIGNKAANRFTSGLLVIYLIILVWVLLFKLGVQFPYMDNRSVNLIPFRQVFLSSGKLDLSETILNVLIFVPLGIYASILFRRWNFGSKLLFFFLVSAMFEGLQFILRIGAFDATDIVTNTSGGIIGVIIYSAVGAVFNSSVQVQRFMNIIAGLGTAIIVLLLLLLKLNMLPIRYQ